MQEPPAPTLFIPLKGLLAVFVFVLAVAAYFPSLGGPFVWDDQALVMRKEVVELQPLHSYLLRPFWSSTEWEGGAGYYRPVSILSLAVDRAIHGDNPTGFHLTNVLLHGSVAMLVFLLAQRLQAKYVASFCTALAFAWFPRLTEAAAWTSGRTDLLASFFSLSALFVTLGPQRGRTVLAGALLLLGLLSKEVALAAGLAIAGYEYLASRGERLRERTLALLPVATAVLVYLVLRTKVLGHNLEAGGLEPSQRLLSALESFGRYGVMLVDGWHPRLNIGFLGHTEPRFVAVGVVLMALILALCLRFRPRRDEGLLVTTAAIALGLVLHILPIHSTVIVADRFMYLPLAGLMPVLAARISSLESSRLRGGWIVGLSGLALTYLPSTWYRARMWGDEIEFWGTAVREQEPLYNALSHQGLSTLLARHGMWDEAMSVLNRARMGDFRNFLLARHNQAQLLAMNGETERALGILTEAARLHPMPRFYASIAIEEAILNRPQQAQEAISAYAKMVDDAANVEELRKQVAAASSPEPLPTGEGLSLEARIERVQRLAKKQLLRVAMAEFMEIANDPAITHDNLRAILTFAFSYGRPAEVAIIHRRLLAVDPSTPQEFSMLVQAREHEAERLRSLCRELGIPVVN